jgi:hypothetical protein
MRTTWEQTIWRPEPLFDSAMVFCIAPGPSLTREICDSLQGRPAIAVNAAGYMAPWADILFFTDCGWFEAGRDPTYCGQRGNDEWPRRKFVEGWRGLVVTFAPMVKRILDDPDSPYPLARLPRVRRVQPDQATSGQSLPMRDGRPGFPQRPGIQCGRSSGHTAPALARAMGACGACLVGYDMRVVDGREHCHSDYEGMPRDLGIYNREFLPAFEGWNAAALNDGFEIYNCTPGSAIAEFPFADLDDMLKMSRAA